MGLFDDAVGVLDEAAADLPQAVGRDSPAPLRFSINLGWAALGAGDLARAWENFVHSLSRGGTVNPDRESAEALLGIGCVLSARADPVAAPMLAGAGELMRRLAVPMSAELRAAVDRAVRSAGGTAGAVVDSEPDGALVQRLRESMVPCDAHDVHLTQEHAWPGRRVDSRRHREPWGSLHWSTRPRRPVGRFGPVAHGCRRSADRRLR